MRASILILLATLALAGTAQAGEAISDATIAAKAAQVETLRARLSTVSSPTASATLLEAESLLRQLGTAPADKRTLIAAQLDAAITRADLEIDAASRR